MADMGASLRTNIPLQEEPVDFSLVEGGPFVQLLVRAHLPRPPTDGIVRRIVALVLIGWMPLLVLCVLSGRAIGGVAVPFLHDLGLQARLLICIPLLLVAEITVHDRIRPVVGGFPVAWDCGAGGCAAVQASPGLGRAAA